MATRVYPEIAVVMLRTDRGKKMKEPKNCCVIGGDEKVIISKTTAMYALKAMGEKADNGGYKMLFADDASFVRAALEELRKAT